MASAPTTTVLHAYACARHDGPRRRSAATWSIPTPSLPRLRRCSSGGDERSSICSSPDDRLQADSPARSYYRLSTRRPMWSTRPSIPHFAAGRVAVRKLTGFVDDTGLLLHLPPPRHAAAIARTWRASHEHRSASRAPRSLRLCDGSPSRCTALTATPAHFESGPTRAECLGPERFTAPPGSYTDEPRRWASRADPAVEDRLEQLDPEAFTPATRPNATEVWFASRGARRRPSATSPARPEVQVSPHRHERYSRDRALRRCSTVEARRTAAHITRLGTPRPTVRPARDSGAAARARLYLNAACSFPRPGRSLTPRRRPPTWPSRRPARMEDALGVTERSASGLETLGRSSRLDAVHVRVMPSNAASSGCSTLHSLLATSVRPGTLRAPGARRRVGARTTRGPLAEPALPRRRPDEERSSTARARRAGRTSALPPARTDGPTAPSTA